RESPADGTTPDRITLFAGQSQVLDSPWPIQRVSVTDPNVVDVQMLDALQVLLQARTAGTTDVTIWGEDERVRRSRVTVQRDFGNIEAELAEVFPRSRLQVSQVRGVVVVRGVTNRAEEV